MEDSGPPPPPVFFVNLSRSSTHFTVSIHAAPSISQTKADSTPSEEMRLNSVTENFRDTPLPLR